MSLPQHPPFSSRYGIKLRNIDSDFPISARIGLIHLLVELVEKDFVDGWPSISRELQRIARVLPNDYNTTKATSLQQARKDAELTLTELPWAKVFDFCERLHSHLAQEIGWNNNGHYEVDIPKGEVQKFISDGLQLLFLEEGLSFEFTDGHAHRRGRKHTVDLTSRAHLVLGDARLSNARKHYDKALQFFRSPTKPDYENSVKEAVCAVEAAGKALFPTAKAATLGDLAKWLSLTKEVSVPKTLAQTITAIYAYRSGGDGIGHGGSSGGPASLGVAEYVLAVCASQVIYLVDLANSQEKEIPF